MGTSVVGEETRELAAVKGTCGGVSYGPTRELGVIEPSTVRGVVRWNAEARAVSDGTC